MTGRNLDKEGLGQLVAHESPSSTNFELVQWCLAKHQLSQGKSTSMETFTCNSNHAQSPIYQLSADVLRSIFELCCPVDLQVKFPLCSILPPTQIILSQVCSSWRQIMLDIPIFWNKIKIEFEKCEQYNQTVEESRRWLSRAKDLPCIIDIFLSRKFDLHPFWPDDLKYIVRDLISPHKCKSLGAEFADHHLDDLLQLPDEKLSCIEDLYLAYFTVDDNKFEIVPPLDFRGLFNLTSVTLVLTLLPEDQGLESTEDIYFRKFVGMPWHQLRHMRLLFKLSALRCLNMLEACSSILETCLLIVVEDRTFATSRRYQITPIRCLQLRKLDVKVYRDVILEDDDSFLLCLWFPKLKSLTLRYSTNCPEKQRINLQTLFKRQSTCAMRLEELDIKYLAGDIDAGALLASIPSLQSCALPAATFTVDAIRGLATGSIGPFLEKLRIYPSHMMTLNELDELLQMIKMRSSLARQSVPPTPFKSVSVYCSDLDMPKQQQYEAIIAEINQSGVELEVHFRFGRFLRP